MIKIRIKVSQDEIEGFSIWGHAGFASKGQDIVCAGVSAVATAALMGLAKLVPERIVYQILPQGLMYCRILTDLSAAEARDVQVILTTMVLGLKAIWQDHAGFIDFAYRR